MASFRWYGADVVVKMPGGVFLGDVGFASYLRDYYVADAWPCRRLGCRLSCPVDSEVETILAGKSRAASRRHLALASLAVIISLILSVRDMVASC